MDGVYLALRQISDALSVVRQSQSGAKTDEGKAHIKQQRTQDQHLRGLVLLDSPEEAHDRQCRSGFHEPGRSSDVHYTCDRYMPCGVSGTLTSETNSQELTSPALGEPGYVPFLDCSILAERQREIHTKDAYCILGFDRHRDGLSISSLVVNERGVDL